MTEKAGAFLITKEALDKHQETLEGRVTSIKISERTRGSLPSLFSELSLDEEMGYANDSIRKGFCLYYEMYDSLQQRIFAEKIDEDINDNEKNNFLGAYSMFAAASFIENRLKKKAQGELMEYPKRENLFNFQESQGDLLNNVLGLYYNITEHRKKQGILKNGLDLINSSVDYFKVLKQEALSKKTLFNKKLVDLVANAEFRIMDEFSISGFEASFEEESASKVEFVPMEPHEVVGNVLAKKRMLRHMDRLALYDPDLQKNPIMELGGLPFTVLYYGLPGTGKTSLVIVGRTRLAKRCDQVNEFRKFQNKKKLTHEVHIIDPGVKDEYYGKTGKKIQAIVDKTRNPYALHLGQIDDIDLLARMNRNDSGGADNDILNVLMQTFSGTDRTLVKRGSVLWWGGTNDPTNMDPALKQRFIEMHEVDGPKTWYDYADLTGDKLKPWIDWGLVVIPLGKGYEPYEMRKKETGYEQNEQVTLLREFRKKIKGEVTLRDIGEFAASLKQKDERFTGRPATAVMEAVKQRINEYDIPEEWFEKPDLFFFKSYEDKVNMIKELCMKNKVNGDIVLDEYERYFLLNQKYSADRLESDVKRRVNDMKVYEEANKRFGAKK